MGTSMPQLYLGMIPPSPTLPSSEKCTAERVVHVIFLGEGGGDKVGGYIYEQAGSYFVIKVFPRELFVFFFLCLFSGGHEVFEPMDTCY